MTKTGRIIGDVGVGVNSILPHMNKWAWDLYIKGCANTWMPTEVGMTEDVAQWKSKTKLTDDERLLVRRNLGFFACSESLVSNNLFQGIYQYVTDPECRQYISRQIFEEALHNHTLVYMCDSLNLSPDELYEAYINIPAIKAKDDFLMKITSDLLRKDFDINTVEGKRELLRNIIAFYLVCEGTFFFSGFAMLLSFKRRNMMPGIGEQIEYTLRDENLHIEFGTRLIQSIIAQNPEVWTEEFKVEVSGYFEEAVRLEVAYAEDALPHGILGLNADMFLGYMQHIAQIRMESIGLEWLGGETSNPFPWLGEAVFSAKAKNFFESRVTEYQVGQMEDDL
jgi:ribonucleoside-diphosphate reductase beta chain